MKHSNSFTFPLESRKGNYPPPKKERSSTSSPKIPIKTCTLLNLASQIIFYKVLNVN